MSGIYLSRNPPRTDLPYNLMASDTLASQPYIDTNALAFALYYARELAEASDEKTRALAADSKYIAPYLYAL